MHVMGSSEPSAADGVQAAGIQPRLPDFFIVGHPKCGTTALYEMLMAHPEVYMPAAKEPLFFATELLENAPPRPSGIPRTLAEYGACFAGARPEQKVGEATSLYLWSRVAAANIAAVQPAAKIVSIIREPASFLRSLHLEYVQNYIETEPDLRTALALEPQRREGRAVGRYSFWPQALLYSDYVCYVAQLERYRAVFPAEQMLVIVYDDFRADNQATLAQVLEFIGVDPTVEVPAREANPTVRIRSRAGHELLHALYVGHGPVSKAVKAAVKSITSHRLRRRALSVAQRQLLFSEPEPPDEHLMTEIRRRFEPEVRALSEYLGRDLVSLWGYDRLD
jgi:hypothetical protein